MDNVDYVFACDVKSLFGLFNISFYLACPNFYLKYFRL